SSEQQTIGERFLEPALAAWQAGTAEQVRLPDLEYTAIRSFAMKRLAILHGQVEPLIDIALLNERRERMLCFLLPPEQLQNRVRIAHVDARFVCTGSGQPVPNLRFSLFFAPDQVVSGSTDSEGRISLQELPLAPYILTLDNEDFCLATADCPVTDPSLLGTEAAGIVARSLLEDFRNKVPVVRAWLEQDARNEVAGTAAIRRYLSALKVTPDTKLTEALRQNCLSVLGLGSSQREPWRQESQCYVHCPQTRAGQGGCLLFLVNLFRKLLGRG
ncbi:MAG: hypothetical protein R3E95_23185, partial [Thiolinea sp.]